MTYKTDNAGKHKINIIKEIIDIISNTVGTKYASITLIFNYTEVIQVFVVITLGKT